MSHVMQTEQPMAPCVLIIRAKAQRGFGLLELVIVLAIVGILSTIAIPSTTNRVVHKQVMESVELVDSFKNKLATPYLLDGDFPESNSDADLPAAEQIKGNFLASVEVEAGAMNLLFGNKAHPKITGRLLTIRPIIVPDAAGAPVSWVCGYDEIPEDMLSPAENKTNIAMPFLPIACR